MSTAEARSVPNIQERGVSDLVGIAMMVFFTLAVAGVLGAFVLWGP